MVKVMDSGLFGKGFNFAAKSGEVALRTLKGY